MSGAGRAAGTILERSAPRTLEAVVARLLSRTPEVVRAEIWVFEDEPARRAAERQLAEAGIAARIRSAYKPLLHAALEDFGPRPASLLIRYPVVPGADPGRFRLETYPLAALWPDTVIAWEPATGDLHYGVTVTRAGGTSDVVWVWAPNRRRTDAFGTPQLCPTGWLRLWRRGQDAPCHDGPLETEAESLYQAVLVAVDHVPLEGPGPWFERLSVLVEVPGIERDLGVGHETVSTHEALHEDLYFGLLETFQRRAGVGRADRHLRPGQIVPRVLHGTTPRVRVVAEPFARPEPDPRPDQDLATASGPLSAGQVSRLLAAVPGERWADRSRQGRLVEAVHRAGGGPGLVVSAGQHANEPSGVVGLLRAVPDLLATDLDLALIALENPDGYALHAALCDDFPRHMHHAARYTAAGDDLEYRKGEPLWETAVRREAVARTRAALHVSLHGYPAHEWTRPMAGYVPPGMAAWMMPRGFFLIGRYRPGGEAEARDLLAAVARDIETMPELVILNRAQARWSALHGHGVGETIGSIPIILAERPEQLAPLVLITEYPDETVSGDAFRLAHDVQRRAVLAAARWLLGRSDQAMA